MVGDLQTWLIAGVEDAADHVLIGTTGRDEEDVDDAPAAHPGGVALKDPSFIARYCAKAWGARKESAERDAALEVAPHRTRQQARKSSGVEGSINAANSRSAAPDERRRETGRG